MKKMSEQYIRKIREKDFPWLDGSGRVYLDNTATSQEPLSVIDRITEYRKEFPRGSNHSANSREARRIGYCFKHAKEKIANYFCATNYDLAITSGTTESSSIIATRAKFKPGDLVLLTYMEHTSGMVPQRNCANDAKAKVNYVSVLPDGRLNLNELERARKGTNQVWLNLVHVSNVTGIVNPVKEIREAVGDSTIIYLDMAQSAGHVPINLDELGVDFAGFSAHKMYGPMGVGGLFINRERSSEKFLRDNILGGGAVNIVGIGYEEPAESPQKFESGTKNLEGVVELGYAIDWINENIGVTNIHQRDDALGSNLLKDLLAVPGVKVYGPQAFDGDRTAVITFNLNNIDPSNRNYSVVAKMLSERKISARDGCFCAQPYMAELLGEDNTPRNPIKRGAVRISPTFYNTMEEIKKAVEAVKEITEELK